jgi:hypothetical protein
MRNVMMLTATVALALAICGCAPAQKEGVKAGVGADLAMAYAPGPAGTYRLTSETWRTAKFEGPELSKEPKLKSGRTGGMLDMVYTADVAGVGPDGSATVAVTIKELKYHSESSSEVTNAFDSTNPADAGKPLAKLIGASYVIKMTPDGKAEVVDASGLRGAITEGSAKDLVAALFSDREIARLHTINGLPKPARQRAGSTWSDVQPSPRGMMDAKNFEKVYTFKGLDNGVAVIEMKAVPSTKPVDKAEISSEAMMRSMFANMMESTDNYTGRIELASGGSLKYYNETLDAQWLATDPQAKPGAEPDRITMGYLQKHTVEKIH